MADKYDKLLKEGLIRLKEAEFSNVPSEDGIEYEFSENYLKSKEKLLNKLDRSYWKYVNTAAKKVAVIIVTLIIAFSSLMTVDAFRETIVEFVAKIYETFTKVDSATTEEKLFIKSYYSIENLPTGYLRCFSNLSDAVFYQIWSNSANMDIILKAIPKHSPNYFNSEQGELIEAIINGTPCLICKNEINYFCYWEFDTCRFELIYPIDLGEEFMSEVVGNLVEIDPEDMQS